MDVAVQARSGVMRLTGKVGDSEPLRPGVSLADFGGGIFFATAVVTALYDARADRRGTGDRHVAARRHDEHAQQLHGRLLRRRRRAAADRLRPSAARALSGLPDEGRVRRHRRRHQQDSTASMCEAMEPGRVRDDPQLRHQPGPRRAPRRTDPAYSAETMRDAHARRTGWSIFEAADVPGAPVNQIARGAAANRSCWPTT